MTTRREGYFNKEHNKNEKGMQTRRKQCGRLVRRATSWQKTRLPMLHLSNYSAFGSAISCEIVAIFFPASKDFSAKGDVAYKVHKTTCVHQNHK